VLRVVEELFYSLRREGFVLSTAQAIDAARVISLLGWDDRASLRSALATVVVEKKDELSRFYESFDRFFAKDGAHPGDLFARLVSRGFSEEEIAALRDLFGRIAMRTSSGGAAIRAVSGPPSELDHLLRVAGVRREMDQMTSPLQVGFYTARVASALGVDAATSVIKAMERDLVDALGQRGEDLARALALEVAHMKRRLRDHVEERARAVSPEALHAAPFAFLSQAEALEMRRAVRRIADKLRGKEQVRKKHAKRGRVDSARTFRRALRTGGVPFEIVRKRPRRNKPKLLVVCDVSESVRAASSFMLEFVAQVMDLFEDARSFVFVSDLAETTSLFKAESPGRALQAIASGAVVPLSATSNYARALQELEAAADGIDRRTTLAILGDGRTNHKADGAEVLARIRTKARGILWLCPEARSSWGSGDSRMPRYARECTAVIEARTVRDLEMAARTLFEFR